MLTLLRIISFFSLFFIFLDWLSCDGKILCDGVYLQFEPIMLENEESGGCHALRDLASKRTVGVWGYAKRDPDGVKTATKLMEHGVRFVNTDLPKNFNEM
jgi:hypothetical protein